MERAKKKLFKLFRDEDLKITAEGGTKVVDYLDIVMDLSKGSYCPYVKPNTTTLYVSTESNHPKSVIDTIPKGVSKRLSRNSSSAEEFDKHSGHFKEALRKAGHSADIVYEGTDNINRKKKRKRNIIYFNPPWSMNIRTKVGAKFLSLVRKHFPPGSPLHKIFNLQTLKVSYSTLPNMESLISSHNKKVIAAAQETQEPTSYGCNCLPSVEKCPLDGECKTPSLVYRADVEAEGTTRYYVGQTQRTFKQRLYIHNSDTKTGRRRTALTNHLLDLKSKNIVPNVSWSKICLAKPRGRGEKMCQLCISEKTNIACGGEAMLNRRSEVMIPCRHIESLYLSNFLQSQSTRKKTGRPPDST